MLPDGPKPQEDGSFKRRYPRRSARARSNMFFGLTPLYGVRSYGEEDIPFYSSSTGKKRGKRSAEGQVDGADDLSTSDEDDLYYYNFTRTVISSGAEERLASHNLFREEEQCDLPKISQLDGVDDGTESDTSVTATTRKTSQIPKRNGKENGTENLKIDRPEDTGEKEHVIKSSVGHKNEPKLDNCHSVSRIKTQGQDSLEAQLSSLESGRRVHSTTPSDKNLLDTYNTELLKSDSDNNNSDDCGNILPSDIMDFVLKNTPSMQALGESPESSSSELLNLGEGLGLDSNREKDMGLFEVFSQQLPTTEPVDSSVSSSISAEEQFELPLELPSDLSVLTTRSPTVPSQNPSRLSVIPDSAEKRVTITEKSVASSEDDSALLSPGVDPAPEGHMTPDHFIQGHMDADISSPPCASVEQGHGNSQDLTRNSSTPGLQASLLPQSVGGTSATATGTPTISQDTGQLTSGPVAGLASSSSVLNVVSMQTTTAPTSSASVPGHVTLTNPRLLGTPDIGSISNLLIKASQQGLGIQDQPVTLPPSSGIFPQLGTSQTPPTAAMTAASSICVLPSAQTMGIAAASPSREAEEHYQLQHVTQLLANKTGILSSQCDLDSAPGTQGSSFTQTVDASHSMGLEQNKALSSALQASSASPGGSPPSGQQSASPSVPGPTKSKPKVKRIQLPLDKGNGKKHKVSHLRTSSSEAHIPDQEANTSSLTSVTGTLGAEAKQQDTANVEQSSQKECGKHAGQVAVLPEVQTTQNPAQEQESTELKTVEEEESNFSSPLMLWLQQEQKRKESITEKKPKKGLIFEISSDDGFQICAESIEDAWKSLTDKVQEARSNARLKQLSFAGVNGLRMLGILHDAVLFLIEQLSGAKHCRNYKFRFHKPEEANEPPLNPHGSARAEVHLRKSAFDMFNFLASKHRQPPEYNPNDEEEEEVQLKSARRATSMDLPMPMRFRHLKKTSKEAVGVYRSPIHGRGLFCKRNIDAGEMVIEYAGNVIRSIQTDKREKYYDSKGIGCYMFRIDDSEVVDATMHGNAARFINHSCEPNCYSRVINIDGQKHIVIFAMRKIYRGEELTYDYKFPIEDASNKLPCNCGAKKCRKFLN
ncbi:hypothetical protein HJG60_011250 [Phyllostomus discolor]|uniref:Histone-lysine N-methyltransferase 2A n=1 Tax=Phyllostomus discolor TaxID=89673 RepID=A0A834E585_9CHIR|nr:hypothetical protein HJG60_011250 [Phyllostomus discolor]